MINYTTATTSKDLEGILALQKANLAKGLTTEEIQSQGFVTVAHSYEQLKKLNDIENHIIASDNDIIAGYVLAMTQQSKSDIPILLPMFKTFESLVYENKKIADYNYLVVGQVCIDKRYRGKGIFDKCYSAYKKRYNRKYDFAITEIVNTNLRSLNAHKRIGFKEIHSYQTSDNTEWIVLLWDWENGR
ncbi:MAG: GNAT family N-acetyltransferase [Ginsengibacter sp.]